MYKSLIDILEFVMESSDMGITFISGENDENCISYRELYDNALKVLFTLQERGIRPGDELVVYTENSKSFITLFWGCILGGIIPVPVSVANNEEHYLKVFNIWRLLNKPFMATNQKCFQALKKFSQNSNCGGVIDEIGKNILFEDQFEDVSGSASVKRASLDDIAFIQFSSGSTGSPKGVILTHGNLITNLHAMIEGSKLDKSDRLMSWMPLTHDMGLNGFHLTPLTCGAHQYIIPTALFIRHPTLWMKKAFEHKATILSSPNFGYKYFLKFFKPEIAKDWDLSHIRLILNGAEPISARLCYEFLNTLKPYKLKDDVMLNVYGLAEASLAVTFPPLYEGIKCLHLDRQNLSFGQKVKDIEDKTSEKAAVFVDLGYPVKDVDVKVCDRDANTLEQNRIGSIYIKGGNVTKGYYNNREATRAAVNADGWLNTGDLGFIRNGRLIVTGREKDIIIVNGQNFYLHDIERILEGQRGIELGEVAACSVFNTVLQKDELMVFVLFKKGPEEFSQMAIDIKKYIYIKIGLEAKNVIPVKKIPKTTSGKIQRYKLTERYLDGEFWPIISRLDEINSKNSIDMTVDRPRNETEKNLVKLCDEVLGVKGLEINDNFFELGIDSVLLTKMADELEKRYPGKVTVTSLFSYPTISKLAEYLEDNGNITISVVDLPEDYFNTGTGTNDTKKDLKFTINGSVSTYLMEISRSEKVEVEDILLAIFTHLFYQITKRNVVQVQAMLDTRKTTIPVAVDFSRIDGFFSLAKVIHAERKNKENRNIYFIKDISKMKLKRNTNSILPLFYRLDVPIDAELIDFFEIMLGFEVDNGQMTFECRYNGKRLKHEKMKALVNGYIKVIKLLVESCKPIEGGVAI